MGPALSELEPRASDEVFHGLRDEDLAGLCIAGHARTGVHGDAAELVADDLALAGMHAGADLDASRARCVAHGGCAADGARGAVEGGEEAVARGINLATAVMLEVLPHERLKTLEELAPFAVAERRGAFGGLNDI